MTLDAERKMQFLYALRSKGVTDARVLTAMATRRRSSACWRGGSTRSTVTGAWPATRAR